MKQILIQHNEANQREIALMEGKQLLCFEKDGGGGIQAEQIYLGKVDRIVKGMEACFVKLGKDTVGFLPFAECIEKPRSGEMLLAQVKKPPVGEKAPYLTGEIALAGRFLLLTPMTPRIAVSKKIQDEEARQRLRDMAQGLCPAGMGLVMRTESEHALEADIAADLEALLSLWSGILEKRRAAEGPCLLQGREDALRRILRDEHGEITEIMTDKPEEISGCGLPIRPCPEPFALYNVHAKLEKSMSRKVWLDCGGYLVIDKTEAMTVIDVNSGKFTGGKSGTESTFLKLNLEAAREIARLMRLRNMGGIIIIDFVDMQTEESRAAVQSELEQALRDDPVKAVVHGFTRLGLMETTRKKKETAL